MKASVRFFESAKKGSPGSAASVIPLDWPYGKTTYSLYSSGLCREVEGLERVCYEGASPFYDFVKDMGFLTAQHLGVEDVESFQQHWLNRLKDLVEDAFTEQERIKIQNEVFGENKAEDYMMKILRRHLKHTGYGRAWKIQLGLFIVSVIVDIMMTAAFLADVDEESLLLNLPSIVGIIVHLTRFIYGYLMGRTTILPIVLYDSLDGSFCDSVNETFYGLQGYYLIFWIVFYCSLHSILARKRGRIPSE